MAFSTWGEHFTIDLPGARAVFTTRRGGASAPPYDSLNLGFLTEDDAAVVAANRDALSERLGVPLAWARQVHGREILTAGGPSDRTGPVPEADGLATATPRLGVMVLVADCLPIVLAGPGAVAVVHAGWPGLAAGVIDAGICAVRRLGAGVGPIRAVIGPGAGRCCYEVGDELRERFAAYGPGVREGRNLDLKAIARRQLLDAGVSAVDDAGVCTICSDPGLLFSHRRDHGRTGRQAGVAWLT